MSSKIKWTKNMIDCDKKYDTYVKNIRTNNCKDIYLSGLEVAAEEANPANLSGYASYQLYQLYVEGEYVAKNIEKARKYFDLGCALGETECLILQSLREETGEEVDKKLADLIAQGTYREWRVWNWRALIRERKHNRYISKTFKASWFLRLKYLIMARFSIPKQKYFDTTRKEYRNRILKMLALPLAIVIGLFVLLIIVAIF